MKKVIRLTESDLIRLVKRVINEQNPRTYVDEVVPRPIVVLNTKNTFYTKNQWDKNNKGFYGFGNIKSSNQFISVTNTFDGKTVKSKVGPIFTKKEKGSMFFTFDFYYPLKNRETKNINFTITPKTGDSTQTNNYTLQGGFGEGTGAITVDLKFLKAGKYTIGNSLNKNYYLSLEVI